MTTYTRTSEATATVNSKERTVEAVLSDEKVALDNHVIVTDGIDYLDYLNGNPVIPWAHQIDQPPVGKMLRIWKRGTALMGLMKFATADEYEFADVVYKLIRGGYLNAVSISWVPIKYERARDKNRPGRSKLS